MFIFGNLFRALGIILGLLVKIYMIVIIIHSLLSWLDMKDKDFMQVLHSLVSPYLKEIKKRSPFDTVISGVDFTPIIGVLLLYFADQFVVKSLLELGKALV